MEKQYSDWLRIDLHIHTDLSKQTKDNDYKGLFSVTTLKEKLKQNNVKIFSLTDHNIININAYKEYYENYGSENDPLLLIGIELDILVKISSREKTYHSLLIFNNSSEEYATDLHKKLETKFAEKEVDNKQRNLTIDEIITLFPEDDFFFIPHAGNTKSIVDSYKGSIEDAQKMVLLMQSAFEKVHEKARQKYNEGFDKIIFEAFKNKNDYAYIEFSDNHNIEKYPCTHKGDDNILHEFYYVKGGKNFETLRLAFIDPESRIKSTSQIKELNTTTNFIESIKFQKDSVLKDNEITFSPHLNVLIGGRSSGKSLMMSILGDKIDSINIVKGKYKIDYDKVTIKSKLDSNYQTVASIQKDELIYIKQGDIVRYFEEKKLIDLAKESDKFAEYEEAKKQFTEHKKELENSIELFQVSYQGCIEDATKRYILHGSTISSILNTNFIFTYESNAVKNQFDNIIKIIELKEVLKRLALDLVLLKDNDVINFDDKERELVEIMSSLITEKQALINQKELSTKIILDFIEQINQLILEKNNKLNVEARQKSDSKQKLQTLMIDINRKFERCFQLSVDSTKLETFNYGLIQEVPINQNVKLVLEVEFIEAESVRNLILDGLNYSDASKSIYINSLGLLKGTKSIKNHTTNSSDVLNKKIIRQLNNVFEYLNNPKDFLSYNNVETSKNNSPGYNSEKYLEIILNNPKSKIIFIDQPEDNLGNRFISDSLVKLIRQIKFQKQIFLVTHNPSIVVYGDAENIIIALNINNIIEYRQVVLENRDSQQEICHILDGGQYIFDMRAKKYNIKRILKEKNNG